MEAHYLTSLPSAIIATDAALTVHYLNPAAEMLLGVSTPQAVGKPLSALPGFTPELCAMGERVLASREELSLFEQLLPLPFNHQLVTMHLTPVMDGAEAGQLLITIEKTDARRRLAASGRSQEITRAAGVMAAMLAHEVKNPLSGIRGAAQLLMEDAPPDQRQLTELICRETDRIRDLLAQVEIFSDGAPGARQPVNIHEVLQYVLSVARTGFGQGIAFREKYDPSLPPVLGHRDLLVQLFLNLVKNAAEALAGQKEATITLGTTYRSGYRMQGPSGAAALPVGVTIEDNGPGIPDTVRAHLFEPLVSSKEQGRGLGLAIVAKIAADLGAVVELDPECEGGTRFTVWLGISPT